MSLSHALRSPRSRSRLHLVRRSSPANRRRRASRARPTPSVPRLFATQLVLVVLCILSWLAAAEVFRPGYDGVAVAGGRQATSQTAPVAGAAPLEGRDYSFLSRVDGHPVHWSCDGPIYLALQGSTPAGTDTALARVAGILRGASGLDLRVGQPRAGGGRIVIRYGPIGTVAGDLRLDNDPELGVGGPAWSSHDGVIRSGAVLIRDDTQLTDPRTPTGARVLIHEIGHVLGLGHSAPDSPEVMGPTTTTGDSDQLGPGDREALAKVGCRRR